MELESSADMMNLHRIAIASAFILAATTAAAEAQVVASLSNGVSIAVLGINDNPVQGRPWWGADGQRLEKSFDLFVPRIIGPRNSLALSVVVRIDRKVTGSDDPADVEWEIKDAMGDAFETPSNSPGPPLSDIEERSVLVPDSPSGATLIAKIAAGEWKTTARSDGKGPGTDSDKDGDFVFGRSYTVGGETHKIVMCPATPISVFRLVAVGLSGEREVAGLIQETNKFHTCMMEYSVKMPANSIAQWQRQSRPQDQRIEIHHISLHRGESTRVQVSTSDSSPTTNPSQP